MKLTKSTPLWLRSIHFQTNYCIVTTVSAITIAIIVLQVLSCEKLITEVQMLFQTYRMQS
jgi:hypothetical protein